MDRLIATNSVNLAGADTAPGSGTPQYATSGDPSTNIPATVFPAYAWNAVQEELIAAIADAGLTPDKNTLTQLRAAIRLRAAAGANTDITSLFGAVNGVHSVGGTLLTVPSNTWTTMFTGGSNDYRWDIAAHVAVVGGNASAEVLKDNATGVAYVNDSNPAGPNLVEFQSDGANPPHIQVRHNNGSARNIIWSMLQISN